MTNEKYDSIKYYDDHAQLYFDQTVGADLSRSYDSFLSKLPAGAYILDFGCGSGRDSKYFLEHGYKVHATDGSAKLCKIASAYIGQDVEQLLFDELDEQEVYDGIWACSSILHAEKSQLPTIMQKMLAAVKPHGIIYASFKDGNSYEVKEGKYYNQMTAQGIQELLRQLGTDAKLIESFQTIPSSKRPNNNYIWNNFLIQKS